MSILFIGQMEFVFWDYVVLLSIRQEYFIHVKLYMINKKCR